jgi:hypothetical protein
MNRFTRQLCLAAFLVSTSLQAYPQSKPPSSYVDRGACPFECCTYRQWKTERTTIAYESPDKQSKRVGTFTAGSSVVGLTGEVRTTPGKFVILKPHKKYKPGDVLWVYTPRGEGFYKVWFKGRMYDEELEYMSGPFEQTHPSCEETPKCWGRLEKQMSVDWWIKIRSANGWVGWTNQSKNFSNMDACGDD